MYKNKRTLYLYKYIFLKLLFTLAICRYVVIAYFVVYTCISLLVNNAE